ncbi:response regulator [Roseococcus pinisoli]|uniref:Response regulator n=1 Tax=Roseococcus pinisoli TaxID=2835040 RepID=A0ABS5QKH9_9PROT|nr:response regulator [Roseococcus pinisoli]MBS7813093.1 response regulator [Roseococcus pinisoli]
MPAAVPIPQETTAADSGPRTILFVEDEVLIAMIAGEMITDLGYRVIEVGSGSQALKVLASDTPVDLLITDYSMPRMTGGELVKAARALRPGLPVLIASGYSQLPDGGDSELPRLIKPYRPEQLRQEIEKLLAAA